MIIKQSRVPDATGIQALQAQRSGSATVIAITMVAMIVSFTFWNVSALRRLKMEVQRIENRQLSHNGSHKSITQPASVRPARTNSTWKP